MNNFMDHDFAFKGPQTDLWSAPRRLNRDYPAKEKEEEGPMRKEENQENVVSYKPKVVLRKRECDCLRWLWVCL